MRNQEILGWWALRENKPSGITAKLGGNMRVQSIRKIRLRGDKETQKVAAREPEK